MFKISIFAQIEFANKINEQSLIHKNTVEHGDSKPFNSKLHGDSKQSAAYQSICLINGSSIVNNSKSSLMAIVNFFSTKYIEFVPNQRCQVYKLIMQTICKIAWRCYL